MSNTLTDDFGRTITSLRFSITKRCNLKCIYCHGEGEKVSTGREISAETIARIAIAASEFGVNKVKFSGGEPLMRNDLENIIASLPELKNVSATTNGILLAMRAEKLAKSGLDRVNISVPSLNKEHYDNITGGKHMLSRVLDGINAAIDSGLTPVKLNMVLLKGINDSELDDVIRFAGKYDGNVILQLIELMNFRGTEKFAVDIDSVEKKLESKASQIWERKMHRRKKYFIDGIEVELVRPIDNSRFCANCTRLRVTSNGKLKACLMRNDNLIEVREDATPEEIKTLLYRAARIREPFYKDEI